MSPLLIYATHMTVIYFGNCMYGL